MKIEKRSAEKYPEKKGGGENSKDGRPERKRHQYIKGSPGTAGERVVFGSPFKKWVHEGENRSLEKRLSQLSGQKIAWYTYPGRFVSGLPEQPHYSELSFIGYLMDCLDSFTTNATKSLPLQKLVMWDGSAINFFFCSHRCIQRLFRTTWLLEYRYCELAGQRLTVFFFNSQEQC